MLHIRAYCENDKSLWNNFVKNNEMASFFHLIEFKEIIEDCFGHKPHYIVAENSNVIKGILPLFELKSRWFGHALISLPSVVYGGVCAIDSESKQALLKSVITLGELINVDYIEMKEFVDSHDNYNFQCEHNCWRDKELYVGFQREIFPEIEENFKAIPRKQRRMIRKAGKYGFRTKVVGKDYLKQFYYIYSSSLRNLGTPVYSYKYLESIMEKIKDTFIFSVWYKEKMVAGVMTFIFKDKIMPYFGGAYKKYYKYAINDYMYWELLKYGCERGIKIFDFGRSKINTGSYHYKRHWGFEPKKLPYKYYLINNAEVPNISPVNPKYSVMIRLWKRLPLPIANWIGPKINRNIP
jgi:FemAB-related protein (PEP-CTERM system-associated)